LEKSQVRETNIAAPMLRSGRLRRASMSRRIRHTRQSQLH
jgi:hypothetical protein